jgi:hypothetical protein
MADWKSLVDRLRSKRNEMARKAVRTAAGLALTSAGRAVERVFGGRAEDAPEGDAAPGTPPDPFAKLKEREREERRRAEERPLGKRKPDGDVDEELAALKKKLAR